MMQTQQDLRTLRPVVRELIADTITPISAYLALGQAERCCLLETVEGTDRMARFSFLGLDYLEATTYVDEPDLLEKVRATVRRYRIFGAERLPYAGGVVATFAYDAARSLERLGRKPPADAPVPDAHVVVPGTWVIFDHFTHRVTLMALAGEEPGAERDAERRLERYVDALLGVRATVPAAIVPLEPPHASIDEASFLDRVAAAKHLIHEGDLYQIQLGVRFDCAVRGTPFDFYRQLRARNPSPYMFFVDAPFGAIFGASPEFLVRLDGRSAKLRPLAGTRSRGRDAADDAAIAAELLANEKERAEHVMLVDLGRNDLGSVAAVGTVRVDELMVIERYSHVMHIVSNVTAELRPDRDALDLFAAAFPAGTVTGAPKIRAMQRIDELETVARGFYAGSIAHFDFNGDMDSCITLRSVQVTDGRAYWQASAGIVADSDPKAEHAEIAHKTRIVRDVLGLRP